MFNYDGGLFLTLAQLAVDVRRRLPFGAPAPFLRMYEQPERFAGVRLYQAGDPLRYAYFPRGGLISLAQTIVADLVSLTAHGVISEPRSSLGEYLVRHWERLALVNDESPVYWLRKLIFRGAWLDQRVKENLLEVDWDDDASEFGYRDPDGGRALLELAPVPSWHELQYRR